MEPIQCSETSAYKIQTPGNYPEDIIIQGILHLPRSSCEVPLLFKFLKFIFNPNNLINFSSVILH
jgi:hypothetical protein